MSLDTYAIEEINPWNSNVLDSDFLFPLDPYESLLSSLGLVKGEWLNKWLLTKEDLLKACPMPSGCRTDWLWGLALPYLSRIERLHANSTKPIILGISGLPGTGKSTFGYWLKKVSDHLNLSVNVVSLDDFYKTSKELSVTLKGNPWDVPRGIPGSHSIDLLLDSMTRFSLNGELSCPQFDKSLRGGLGDRSAWINTSSKVLIIEGWFIGCKPEKEFLENSLGSSYYLNMPLTNSEIDYRVKIQDELKAYLPVWDHIHELWHIRPEEFNFVASWKKEQELNMISTKGSGLKGQKLQNFIRMIHNCIPQESLMNIQSDHLIIFNQQRQLLWVGDSAEYI